MKRLFPVLLYCVFLITYLLGVSPSSLGGDSGDIILSYYFGSISHPPGYPLNTMLGWMLSRLIGFFYDTSFVFNANAVSAVYMALAVALLYSLVLKLIGSKIISLFASLFLGFSALFWLYSHSAEVFQLTLVLVLLAMNFLFSWSLNRHKRVMLYLSFLFLGLAVFHHHTAILFLPSFLYLFLKNAGKSYFKIGVISRVILLFLLGFVPYLFVFYASIKGNLHNWENVKDFASLLRLVLRTDYGTFSATSGLVGFNILDRLIKVIWYFKFLIADFSILGIIFFLSGSVYLYFKKRDWFWFFLIAWFLSGPFFLFYASFPFAESFLKGVTERFLLSSYIVSGVLIGFGLLFYEEILRNHFYGRYKIRQRTQKIVLLLFLVIPFSLGWANYLKADLSDYVLGKVFSEDILSSPDPPGILFLQSDTASFNTQYSHFVEGVGTGNKVVAIGRLRKFGYRENLKKQYSDLNYPANFNSLNRLNSDEIGTPFLEANIDKIPIYTHELIPANEKFVLVAQGMVYRIYRKQDVPTDEQIKTKILESINKITFREDLYSGQYIHFFADSIIEQYKIIFYRNGAELLARGFIKQSQDLFFRALELDKEYRPALFSLGVSYLEEKKCLEAKNIFETLIEKDKKYWQAYEAMARYYAKCVDDPDQRSKFLEESKRIRTDSIEGFDRKFK